MKRLTPAFALWLLVVVACVCGKTDRRPQMSAPAFEVSAKTLFHAYQRNEVSADETYKGKVLVVTGIVDRIGKDIIGTMYVTLETGEVMTVQCMFGDENKNDLAGLEKGDAVKIKGHCDGKLGNVILSDCAILSK